MVLLKSCLIGVHHVLLTVKFILGHVLVILQRTAKENILIISAVIHSNVLGIYFIWVFFCSLLSSASLFFPDKES